MCAYKWNHSPHFILLLLLSRRQGEQLHPHWSVGPCPLTTRSQRNAFLSSPIIAFTQNRLWSEGTPSNVLQVVSAIGRILFQVVWATYLVLFSGHLLWGFSPRRAQLVDVITIETAPRGWKYDTSFWKVSFLVISKSWNLKKSKVAESLISFYQRNLYEW